ncbi:MAG TPA: hypothetical protein VJR29_14980 [bacterium]|nr:hypothetical protein [bacterium]
MGVGSVPGGGSGPVDTGGEAPQGPPPGGEGGDTGPQSTGGAGEGGTSGVGGEEVLFESDFGYGTEPPPDSPETTDADDMASRQLCNTIALRCTEDLAARNQVIGSHDDATRADANTRADAALQQEGDTYRADARSETRSGDLGEAFRTGDRRAIDSFFKNIMGGNREGSSHTRTASGNQPGTVPNPNPGGTMTPTRGRTEGGPGTAGNNPPTNPPIFPGATGRLATLTQPRMDALAGRIANMPNGEQKTQAQQLETRLRAAIASGNQEEASQIMDQLAAMGIEVGGEEGTDEADEIREEGEIAEGEGEGEGEGIGTGRRGEGGEGGTPRLARTRFGTETLSAGMMVFHGGDGPNGEGGDHLTRMGTGLRTVLSGRGTEAAARLSTDDAVRGVLYEGGGGDGDSASGGGSRDSSVEFGSMVDTDGALARGGMRLDTAAAGIGGAYGIRTSDGRFIPQWMAMSEHGGLPPGVRSAISRDAALRTRFGAEAVSGASAGRTGDLWAGMRC